MSACFICLCHIKYKTKKHAIFLAWFVSTCPLKERITVHQYRIILTDHVYPNMVFAVIYHIVIYFRCILNCRVHLGIEVISVVEFKFFFSPHVEEMISFLTSKGSTTCN